jgi:hypothetical protein
MKKEKVGGEIRILYKTSSVNSEERNITNFFVILSHNLIEIYGRFGGTYQTVLLAERWSQRFLLKTRSIFNKTTWRVIQGDDKNCSYRCGNLKSH